MIVTEAEALTKWCPETRVAFLGSLVGNRPSTSMIDFADREAARTGDDRDLKYLRQQQADTHCIGSRCMFWQWAGQRKVPNGNDEAHGTCGSAPDFGPFPKVAP